MAGGQTVRSVRLPFPPGLDFSRSAAFVGRNPELDLLRSLTSSDGKSTVAVFVGGEPGVGKSRLVSEYCRTLHSEGGLVLFGTCEEDLDLAYQPFAEALRAFVEGCPLDVLEEYTRQYGSELTRMVPELAARIPDLEPPLFAEPESERFRLFEAAKGALATAAVVGSVVLVLDDLQWATKPTLLLLRHLLREPSLPNVVVLGLFRSTETSQILQDTLAELRRSPSVERVSLRGLDHDGVVAYLEAAGRRGLGDQERAFARRLQDETGGSPFFVGEILRHLMETGAFRLGESSTQDELFADPLELPTSIQEVVGRRLRRLRDETRTVLSIASVIGPTFSLRLLRQLEPDIDPTVMVEAIEEALGAGMIEDVPGSPGSQTFAHALVRRAVYEQLSVLRRARLHRRVAEILESSDPPGDVGELAFHYLTAAADGVADKAIEYAKRAADQATERVAYEEAVRFLERALEVADWAGLGGTDTVCDLELALADAQWKAGDVLGSRSTYEKAFEAARRTADPERLARAALRSRTDLGGYAHAMAVEEGLVSTLEEALDATPEKGELRARLEARLAVELYYDRSAERRRAELADEAAAMAGALGAPEVLLYTLHCREWATFGPDVPPAVRLERAAAVLELAHSLDDLEVAYQARFLRFVAHLELGDLEAADTEAEAGRELGHRLGIPGFVPWVRAYDGLKAWIAGRLEEADATSAQALSEALERRGDPDLVFAVIGAQTLLFRYLRDLGVALPTLEPMLDQFPAFQALRAGMALGCLQAGDMEGCRRHFEVLAGAGLENLPRDGTWLLLAAMAGSCCAALGDKEQALLLYDLLLPFSDRWIAAVVTTLGPVTRVLGELAAALGWDEAAEVHFKRALDQVASSAAPLFEAEIRYGYAAVLVRQGTSESLAQARRELDACLAIATELGLPTLEGWARNLAGQLPASA